MAYDLSGRALYPLSGIFPKEQFPLVAYVAADVLDPVFAGLYYTDAEAYVTDEGLHVNLRLAFEGELALAIPGIPLVSLVAGAAGPAWTSLDVAFVVGPEPSAELADIPLALRVDRSLLKPMRSPTEIDPGPGVDIALGTLSVYASGDGIATEVEAAATLPLSMVGDTGVLIEADRVFLRLSDGVHMPAEATALGLDPEWRGLYVGAAELTLPEGIASFAPNNIVLEQCLIGSSGVSGSLDATWQPPHTADLFGVGVSVSTFGLTITGSTLTRLDLAGSLAFDGLTAENGEAIDATISLAESLGSGEYELDVAVSDRLRIADFLLDLPQLSLTVGGEKLAAHADGTLTVPAFTSVSGGPATIVVELDVDTEAGTFAVATAGDPDEHAGEATLAFEALEVTVESFAVSFSPAAFDVAGAGYFTLPGVTSGTLPATIGFEFEFDDPDYRLTVVDPPPFDLGFLTLDLADFDIRFNGGGIVEFLLGGTLTFPMINDANGAPAAFGVEWEVTGGPSNPVHGLKVTSFPTLDFGGFALVVTQAEVEIGSGGLNNFGGAGTLSLPVFKRQSGAVELSFGIAYNDNDGGFEFSVDTNDDVWLGPFLTSLDFTLGIDASANVTTAVGGTLSLPDAVDEASGGDMSFAFTLLASQSLFELTVGQANLDPFRVAGVLVTLSEFYIKFGETGFLETRILGEVTVDAFNGPIGISIELGDGFGIEATLPTAITAVDVAGIKVALESFALTVRASSLRLALGGDIENSNTVPLLEELFPSNIEFDVAFDSASTPEFEKVDVALTWPSGMTAETDQEGAVSVEIPIGEISSELTIRAIHIRLQPEGSDFRVTTSLLGAVVQIGPVLGMIDGAGLTAMLRATGGNLGPVDATLSLEAPTSVGLEVRDDSIEVGGVLSYDDREHRYAGLVHVKSGAIRVHALGIYEQLPNGSPSIVVAGGATFPPIPLFAGLTLTGAGALVGVNRRIDEDELGSRVRTGGVANLLSAPDPVANASRLLSDLATIMPPSPNVHCIGASLQLSFMIAKGDLGLIFEFADGDNAYGTTGVTKIMLVGSGHVVYPESGGNKGDYIDIHKDSLGVIDLVDEEITYDGSLYNSSFLIFRLYGDSAVRIKFGGQPYFLVSIGGVHPWYNPAPYRLPNMQRAGVSGKVDVGFLTVELTLDTYFALASNAVMLGAEVQISAKFIGIVEGKLWFGFDALIQFDPIYFSVGLWGGVEIKLLGFDLASGYFTARLSGPGPTVFDFTIGYSLLFGLIKDEHKGSVMLDHTPQIPTFADITLLQAVLDEIGADANVQAVAGGPERHVLHRAPGSADEPAVSPFGRVRWAQNRVPLACLCDRLDGKPLGRAQKVNVSPVSEKVTATPVRGWFAPNLYSTVNMGMALYGPGFMELQSGFELSWNGGEDSVGSAEADGGIETVIHHDLGTESITDPNPSPAPLGVAMAAKARTGPASIEPGSVAITAEPEQWKVVTDGGVAVTGTSQFDAQQTALHHGGVAVPAGDAVTYRRLP